MNRTKIEYLDYTWNPTVGCTGINCAVRENCWARRMAKRQKHRCQLCYDFVPHRHPERLNEPLLRKKPARIGVSFLGDLFDTHMDAIWINRVFQVMSKASWHTFVSLTKQAYNMNLMSRTYVGMPKNVWLGVTVNREVDLKRIEYLKEIETEAIKFVSFEPLYEDLGNIDLAGIDWVIIGAQTRPERQPELEWVRHLIDAAKRAGAAIFLKNNLHVTKIQEFLRKRKLQEFPEGGCSS